MCMNDSGWTIHINPLYSASVRKGMVKGSFSTDSTELSGLVKFGILVSNFQHVSGLRLSWAWITLCCIMDYKGCFTYFSLKLF
jgi:hypothetical protein